MLTLKNTVVLVDQLLLQKWSVSNDWQTYAYKYKQVLIRKNCTVVYWWLYHCALEINTGNCTFLTYVNSHGSRNAQIYKRRSASCAAYSILSVKHSDECPWRKYQRVVLLLLSQIWGITWKKTVLTAFNSIGRTSLLNIDNGVFK